MVGLGLSALWPLAFIGYTFMDDELKKLDEEARDLHPASVRAERAKQIIEDTMVVEAFEAIEKSCLEGWKQSDGNDSKLREKCYQQYRAVTMFKDTFERHLREGTMANSRMLQINERRKTIKERMFS